jgi:excisionase family DNA binding protein
MEELLQVDRSTIYRMAERGQLPAVKVGKQWRFPSDQVTDQFQISAPALTEKQQVLGEVRKAENGDRLASVLPIECVQLIQESFADLLGVMLVITDMEGQPITTPSNSCGLFDAVKDEPGALQKCISSWAQMATSLELEPKFTTSHLGLLCARALIRVGSELQGMVVAGCVSPEQWPPDEAAMRTIADEFGVSMLQIEKHKNHVYKLSARKQQRALLHLQKIADIVAHIVNERVTLVDRLEAIADLTAL